MCICVRICWLFFDAMRYCSFDVGISKNTNVMLSDKYIRILEEYIIAIREVYGVISLGRPILGEKIYIFRSGTYRN